MRFGVCCAPDQTAALADVPLDYVEWPVASTVGAMDDAAFRGLARDAARLPFRPEVWNVLLPQVLMLVGPAADHEGLRRYAGRTLPRLRALGGEVVVLGSGLCRAVPEGWPRAEAETQFGLACRILAEEADRRGLTIALEPLNRRETNLVTTFGDAVRVVALIDAAAFRVLADLYHMAAEDEPFAAVRTAAPVLAHVHVAAPITRTVPGDAEAVAALRSFLGELAAAGYDRRISLECVWKEPEEIARGLAATKAAWRPV